MIGLQIWGYNIYNQYTFQEAITPWVCLENYTDISQKLWKTQHASIFEKIKKSDITHNLLQ